ncbi:MAG: cupin domain-containing protein [Planctomycetota bacterium]
MAEEKPLIRRAGEAQDEKISVARDATIKIHLGPDQGLPNFEIREFTLQPGGRIPSHRHDVLEHGQLVLEGEMTMLIGSEEHTVRAGDSIFLPEGAAHWYENRGEGPVRFLCVIPRKPYGTEWLEK